MQARLAELRAVVAVVVVRGHRGLVSRKGEGQGENAQGFRGDVAE